jgi:hypothetical protein
MALSSSITSQLNELDGGVVERNWLEEHISDKSALAQQLDGPDADGRVLQRPSPLDRGQSLGSVGHHGRTGADVLPHLPAEVHVVEEVGVVESPGTSQQPAVLGSIAYIVAAAMEIDPPERSLVLEWAAVICLTAGSLIPVFGWLTGVVLLWSSGLWRRSEKILATLIFPGGPALASVGAFAIMGLATSSDCLTPDGSPPCAGFTRAPVLSVALLLIALTAPVVVAIVLLNRARRRAAFEAR